MLSRFSVRKPYTIVVAVVAVLILGVVAFMNMTTDLLPSFDLPYLVVVTTYPGATPEEVETAVTKPLEQTLATTSNIKSLDSTSSENYSMIMLEFYNDVNMDSTIIEINGKIDMLESAWSDDIGAPMIIKLNPDAMPIMVASVDADGADIREITALTEDVVMPAIESIDGVASVDADGLYEEQIKVSIDEQKLDELNRDLKAKIDAQLDEAAEALDEASAAIEAGEEALAAQSASATQQLEQATNEMTSGKIEVAQMEGQLTSAETQLAQLRGVLATALEETNKQIAELEARKAELEQGVQPAPEEDPAAAPTADPASPAEPGAVPEAGQAAAPEAVEQAAVEAQAEATPTPTPAIPDITDLPSETEVELAVITASLEQLYQARAQAEQAIASIDAQLAQIAAGRAALQAGKDQIAQGEQQLAQGKGALTQGLNTGAIELASGKAVFETQKAEFDAARESAQEQADVSGMITPDVIMQLLYAQNFAMPAGTITEDGKDYIVKVGDEIHGIEELRELVIFDMGMDDFDVIRLQDVANVEMVDNADEVYATINGNQGIILSMQKQSMYSTADVSDKISERIAQLEDENPGMHITTLMDQGVYIDIVVGNVMNNLLYGAILAVAVLLLFLRNIKPTLIIATSIPISVVFALVLMYFSGVTLNVISLAGLALGVGMLVDNSIVVIENIFRMRALGVPPRKAAIEGARQVGGAIIASTLTTVCVFLPIVFVQGISRQLFSDMGLTIAYSLLASLLVALTLVPAMSASLMKNEDVQKEEKKSKIGQAILKGYEKALSWTLRFKPVVLIAVFALFGWCMYNVFSMGIEFMPKMDSTQLTATMEMPPEHRTFEETADMANEVIDRVMTVPDVQTVGAVEGGMDLFGGGGSAGAASFYVILDEDKTISSQQAAEEIRKKTEDLDCEISVSDSMMDFSALSGEGISVVIKGQDLDVMQEIARDVAVMLEDTEGTMSVSDGLEDAMAEARIIVDKGKAMAHNLTVAQVYTNVSSLVSAGRTATQIDIEDFEYPVIVVDGAREQATREDIMNMEIQVEDRQGNRETIQLKDIAVMEEAQSLSSISRQGQVRYITASALVDTAHNVGLVSRDFSARLANYDVPEGYTVEVAGENQTIMDALDDLIYMLLLAIALIYLIMVAQFQSLLSPFIVMFTIPLAFTGGLLALLLAGMDISVIAMLGFLMLAGIIVNNGIVLVDYINQLRREGMDKRAAIIEAGKTRMRPIFMTALTTILGLFTMALGIGQGADMLQPMAVVTIGGLLYGTLLTLFVVPALYDAFNRKEIKDYTEEDTKGGADGAKVLYRSPKRYRISAVPEENGDGK